MKTFPSLPQPKQPPFPTPPTPPKIQISLKVNIIFLHISHEEMTPLWMCVEIVNSADSALYPLTGGRFTRKGFNV